MSFRSGDNEVEVESSHHDLHILYHTPIRTSAMRSSKPLLLRAMRARVAQSQLSGSRSPPVLAAQSIARPVSAPTPSSSFQPIRIASHPFSSSSRSYDEVSSGAGGSKEKAQDKQQSGEGSKGGDKQQQRKGPRPDESSAPPKSPFAVFAQVLKEEISKNKAWQDNVKQLQGDVDKLADTQAMKRAREVYERARVSFWSVVRLDMILSG